MTRAEFLADCIRKEKSCPGYLAAGSLPFMEAQLAAELAREFAKKRRKYNRRSKEARLQEAKERLAELEEYAALGADSPCVLGNPPPGFLRQVLVAYSGEPPPGAVLCRRCSEESCIRPDHLFWGTRTDAQRIAVYRGTGKGQYQELLARARQQVERLGG